MAKSFPKRKAAMLRAMRKDVETFRRIVGRSPAEATGEAALSDRVEWFLAGAYVGFLAGGTAVWLMFRHLTSHW